VIRVRRMLWSAGAPLRLALIGGIALYRVSLSGWLGGQCRYLPTCSRYAEDAIRTHGAVKGSLMAIARIARCNPFGRGGLDPVRSSNRSYDNAIQPRESRRAG
jgi:putative membrane protein insertion efficiency factor